VIARAAAILAILAIATPAIAVADPDAKPLPPHKPGKPDRWAVYGGEEANLEGTGIRSGFAFAGYLGPAIQIGVDMDHATGTGGSFSFRLGRFADRDTIITVELAGTVFPQRFDTCSTNPPPSDPCPTANLVHHLNYNQSTLAAFGAQTYVAPILWIRMAVGFAAFTRREAGAMRDSTASHFGGGAVVGAGLEIVRRKSVSLALELLGTGAVYPTDGVIIGGGLGLSLGIY
jgi:hypothetical protein